MNSEIEHIFVYPHFEELNEIWSQRKVSTTFCGTIQSFGTYGRSCLQVGITQGLSGVHDVFHVSQLKKCHTEMADILLRDTVPLEAIQLDSDLTYEEKLVKILEYASRVTRGKVIKFCKVQWSHHTEDETTWEREEELLKDHPHLFSSQPESRGRDSS